MANQDYEPELPQELWSKIMSKLSSKDLCSIAMTCRFLGDISADDELWSRLLSSDLTAPNPPPSKMLTFRYKDRYRIRKSHQNVSGFQRTARCEDSEVLELAVQRLERDIRRLKSDLQRDESRMGSNYQLD